MAMDGQILMLGDYGHREFQNAVSQMEEVADVLCFRSADAASIWLASSNGSPRLIVVAQSRPGQFHAANLEAIHGFSPLSRMAVLLGSWCEGETRSGFPYPGIERVYFHAWNTWFARRWPASNQPPASNQVTESNQVTAAVQPADAFLLRTATPNDFFLAESRVRISQLSASIGISSRNADTVDALRDAFKLVDVSLSWLSDCPIAADLSHLDLAIAHDVEPRESRMESIAEIESLCPGVPILAMIDFPRWDEIQILERRVAGLISQPYRIGDLIDTVSQILVDRGLQRDLSPKSDPSKSRQAA
jgi:hypothetical protein